MGSNFGLLSLSTLVVIAGAAPAEEPIPDVLAAAFSSRDFTTGRIEFIRRIETGAEIVTQVGTALFAGQDNALDMCIDPPEGLPPQRNRRMSKDGALWQHMGSSLAATVDYRPINTSVEDFRRLGIDLTVGDEFKTDQFEVSSDGTETLVIERLTGSAGTTVTRRYWIDQEIGPAITRVEIWAEDRCLLRNVINYTQFGKVWFPSTVAKFDGAANKPRSVTSVLGAVLDDPSLPRSLSPEEIGVEVGTNLSVIQRNGMPSPGRHVWNGEAIADFGETGRRILSGELTPGPNYAISAERANAGEDLSLAVSEAASKVLADAGVVIDGGVGTPTSGPSRPWALWEQFVEDWIRKHRATKDQAQRAWAIHADCVQRAESILRKHRRERSDQRNRASAPVAVEPADSALERRIAEIFEERLVPRLDRLLTRVQRYQEGTPPPKP